MKNLDQHLHFTYTTQPYKKLLIYCTSRIPRFLFFHVHTIYIDIYVDTVEILHGARRKNIKETTQRFLVFFVSLSNCFAFFPRLRTLRYYELERCQRKDDKALRVEDYFCQLSFNDVVCIVECLKNFFETLDKKETFKRSIKVFQFSISRIITNKKFELSFVFPHKLMNQFASLLNSNLHLKLILLVV